MDIHWQAVTDETVRHLQNLLRLDTTNPPGNESLAAEYLAGVLQAEGLQPLVLEGRPGRGNVVARLTGSGEKPPLMLYGHTDVVPAEAEHWTHPPFAGVLADGCVWGRGAVDMKGTVAQQLTSLLLLKRQGLALKRDIIFAATADEEVGGDDSCGMAWLVRHHRQLVEAEFGLTEVGGYSTQMGGKTLFPIQVAEKGLIWLKVRAHGKPGHASMPHNENAVATLAAAVHRLASHGLPYHLTPAAEGFLKAAADGIGGPMGEALAQLRTPQGADAVLKSVITDGELQPYFHAMLHNTATPTGLSAGYKTNVIPSTAEAVIDGRNLPGCDADQFLAELRAVMGEGFDYEVTMQSPSIEAPHDTPLFRLLAEALERHEPGAIVAPYMMAGATDAKYLATIQVPSYGFSPLKLPPDFHYKDQFHAHDERVPVAALGWGTRVLYEAVRDYGL